MAGKMKELQDKAKDAEYWAKQHTKGVGAPGNSKETNDYLKKSGEDLDTKARATRQEIRSLRDAVDHLKK